MMAMALSYAGTSDEALYHIKQGIRLDPYPEYWYYWHLGRCYGLNGQYEDALTAFKKTLHLNPSTIFNYMWLASIYALLDRQEEAEAAARKVLEINPNFSTGRASKAWPYKNPADRELLVDAMRKAGLPE